MSRCHHAKAAEVNHTDKSDYYKDEKTSGSNAADRMSRR
jgi:hypothetical protein